MRKPEEELEALQQHGLRRRLRCVDRDWEQQPAINFSSNDYLGLASDPRLKEIFREAISRHGVGSGASRLVCGTMAPHLDLEEKIAALKKAEAALTFTSGFAAATGSLPALAGKEDFLILDKLCHASLIDGARLSGATFRTFPHNDLDKLESQLKWARGRAGANSRVIVVTESVFSMDGDLAPLDAICELKERHGALLLVDEAHAFGVIGPQGRGLAAERELESRVDFQMGTFSKAIGLTGAYLCARRPWIDLLINRSRSFIYSTAPAPALAATVSAALDLATGPDGEERRRRLRANIQILDPAAPSAILPVIVGDNEAALKLSERLLEAGFLIPAIRYPTVPKGSARLRVTLSSSHRPEEVEKLRQELAGLL